jgi:transcriptional regulator with XRE-family HTH domain
VGGEATLDLAERMRLEEAVDRRYPQLRGEQTTTPVSSIDGAAPGNNQSRRDLITDDFSSMVRQRRRERGLTQEYVAARLQIEERRSITQSYLAEIERGHHPHPRPHLIEEFARVLSIDRYILYMAARVIPPEVADRLARLTIEEREVAWRVFMRAINQAEEEKKARDQCGNIKVGRNR